MTNLENSSGMPLKKIPKWLIWTITGIAFIGLMDATYLTAEHYSGVGINCVIFTGCDQVANSEYSILFGIPVALYGVAYYFGILFVSLLYIDLSRDHIHPIASKIIRTTKILNPKLLPIYTLVGFVMSLRFVYLQIAVIQAVCTYCMVSVLTSTLLFIFGMIVLKNRRFYF